MGVGTVSGSRNIEDPDRKNRFICPSAGRLAGGGRQRHPQVFAASHQGADTAADQAVRAAAQWPAQRFAQARRLHLGPFQAVRQAGAGDFDFG